ncbi:MAG: 3-phosphoshikimate 1-carboxyvinyltransferase, partial [Thermodesulfobacteriota bacterium]
MSKAIIKGGAPLRGDLTPPGDKSISHRAAIIGSLSNGPTTVRGFLFSNDTLSSINAMMSLGIPIESNPEFIRINGKGLFGLSEPEDVIDAGNSGTTARLLTGLLSAQNFFSTISGDKYLRVRPMNRVVEPLRLMGARISGRAGGKRLPLAIEGNKLSGVKYHPPVASSQIKSAILLAGLFAEGETEVIELKPTRDHTERMFSFFGVKVERDGLSIKIRGHQ